jgi:hypothetical protein
MRSALNQKDTEILFKNQSVNLDFGSSKDDYVEVFLYDTNDNLLETNIVEESDYRIDSDGVKLKTGTILRKMGFDRGRYRVKYNFLRKTAGSYETVLVDSNNKIYNGPFHVMDNGNIMKGAEHTDGAERLLLKENKYLVQQISPTRTEVRVISQNIDDEKYKNDLFFSGKQRRKEKVDLNLRFINRNSTTDESELEKSVVLRASSNVPQSYLGGLIYLNNAFIEEKIFAEPPLDPSITPEEEVVGDIQARWIFSDTSLTTVRDGTPSTINNTLNKMWLDFSKEEEAQGNNHPFKTTPFERKLHYEKDRGKTNNRKLRESIASQYQTPVFEKGRIKLKSVSTKPSETSLVKYTWTLSGIDFTKGDSYDGTVGPDEALITESGGVRYENESTNGSEIEVQLRGNNTDIAVTLEIESKLANGNDVSSILYIPNVIRTVGQ